MTSKVTSLALFNGLNREIFNRLALAAEVWDGVAFVDQLLIYVHAVHFENCQNPPKLNHVQQYENPLKVLSSQLAVISLTKSMDTMIEIFEN